MTRDLIVSCTPHETKVALLEDGSVAELFIERDAQRGVVGNIYKGRVTRVLPGMQSAFVELGLEREAFLHAADVFEELDENLLTPEERASARGRETPIEELLREGQDLIVQVLKGGGGTRYGPAPNRSGSQNEPRSRQRISSWIASRSPTPLSGGKWGCDWF